VREHLPGELDVHNGRLAGIGPDTVNFIKTRAPDLDVLGIQSYADIVNLPRYLKDTGWTGPYIVTEWGATGHWEVGLLMEAAAQEGRPLRLLSLLSIEGSLATTELVLRVPELRSRARARRA